MFSLVIHFICSIESVNHISAGGGFPPSTVGITLPETNSKFAPETWDGWKTVRLPFWDQVRPIFFRCELAVSLTFLEIIPEES